MNLKASYVQHFQALESQSAGWADRVRTRLEKAGVARDLERIGQRNSSYPTPWQVNRMLGIINGMLQPPSQKTTPAGSRGGTALAGALSRMVDRFTDRGFDDGSSSGSSKPTIEVLKEFRDAIRVVFRTIGDDAYEEFVENLHHHNWTEKTPVPVRTRATRVDSVA